MPHVEINRTYLKVCMRKRPFATEEEASREKAELYEVYQCIFCRKWHRASRPEFKAERRSAKNKYKQRLNLAARRKKQLLKAYQNE
jgi:hypothetical protein